MLSVLPESATSTPDDGQCKQIVLKAPSGSQQQEAEELPGEPDVLGAEGRHDPFAHALPAQGGCRRCQNALVPLVAEHLQSHQIVCTIEDGSVEMPEATDSLWAFAEGDGQCGTRLPAMLPCTSSRIQTHLAH